MKKIALIVDLVRTLLKPQSVRSLLRVIKENLILIYRSDSLPQWSRADLNKTSEKTIRIGFIGAGKFAEYHLKALQSFKDVELYSLCSTGSERSRAIAEKYKFKALYTSLNDYLEDSVVDGHIVVVPITELKQVTMACLATGKPVLMEKPAGISPQDTRDLIAQATKFDTYAMVGYNRRFYSSVEHGLAALAQYGPIRGGVLEVPEPITFARQLATLPEVIYDNFMYCQSTHAIDLFRHILGDIDQVKSISKPNYDIGNAAASFCTSIQFSSGAMGSILALWDTHSVSEWKMRIIAEKGVFELDKNLKFARIYSANCRGIPVTRDSIDQTFRPGIFAQDLHFINAIRDHRKPCMPACLLEDALETNLLIEKIIAG